MNRHLRLRELREELCNCKDLKLFDTASDREKFSRDFFDYSPVLKKKFEGCLAELVVKPMRIEAVSRVAEACGKYSIPLTIRGSGTGNYGQCVPLHGGVVMLMGELSQIRNFNPLSGEVTVEAGCLLRDLDDYLASYGRQLRLLPSTWKSASIGGFFAGGSGGIGSVRWGFLRDPGHLLGIEVVTVNDPPEKLQLDLKAAEALNHAYGTNGIITALTLATAPAVAWQEIAIDCDDWAQALAVLESCSKAAVEMHLCTLLENRIIEQIPLWSGPSSGKHRLLILVAPAGVRTLERLAVDVGAFFNFLGPENVRSGQSLRELSWNHTTLHMRKVDSGWTYLQMLLPQPELPFMKALNESWGDDLLWHLEAVRQQGAQRVAALPLVKWKGLNLLEEIMEDCTKLGAIIFNPHVMTVEDGGLGVIDGDQVQAKRFYDPAGILNPGKLRGWSE